MEVKKKMKKRNKKGFTLIELVVVIAILGILAAILIPVIGGFITRANDATDQANARNLYNCVAMALATGSDLSTVAAPSTGALAADIVELFGSLPSGASYGYTVTNGVAVDATFNGQTYNGDGTFSGS